MVAPKLLSANSLTTFTKYVEQLITAAAARYPGERYSGNWYRGVGLAESHKLSPTLYRHPTIRSLEDLIILERKMMNDFRRQGVLHTGANATAVDHDDLRTLFYMQHYQVPTRLLDWSTNPFIALYFALTSAPVDPATRTFMEDAAVWVLDPVAWNKVALGHVSHGNGGPLSDETAKDGYGPREIYLGKLGPTALTTLNERPATILGAANNARMFAQRGVFTIFGRDLEPLESQYEAGKFPAGVLTKLIVAKSQIQPMLEMLLNIGYTDSMAYPDLQGLALEIKRFNGFRV